MRNKQQEKIEMNKRTELAIKRGYFETKADIAGRLLASLSKQWITPEGKIFTLRAYLLKYDRAEYKKILRALQTYHKGASFFDRKGDNLDWFHREIKLDPHVNYEGRPHKLVEFHKEAYKQAA